MEYKKGKNLLRERPNLEMGMNKKQPVQEIKGRWKEYSEILYRCKSPTCGPR